MDPQTLESLPGEVIDNIAQHLPEQDLQTFRQVSRMINQKIYFHFTMECFRRPKFMLLRESLECLIAISQHPVLRKRVRTLVIGSEYISSREIESIPLEDPENKPRRRERRIEYHKLVQDQAYIRKRGIDIELPAQALRTFTRLDGIVIQGKWSERLPRSWGCERVHKRTAVYPHPGTFDDELKRRTRTVLSAIAASGIQLRSFETTERFSTQALRMSSPLTQGVQRAFSTLRSLKLLLNRAQDDDGRNWLGPFLASLSANVEELELDFGAVLSGRDLFAQTSVIYFPALKRFKLRTTHVRSGDVITFLYGNEPTLQEFRLENVNFEQCEFIGVMRALARPKELKDVSIKSQKCEGRNMIEDIELRGRGEVLRGVSAWFVAEGREWEVWEMLKMLRLG